MIDLTGKADGDQDPHQWSALQHDRWQLNRDKEAFPNPDKQRKPLPRWRPELFSWADPDG